MNNEEKILFRMKRTLSKLNMSDEEKKSLINEAYRRVCIDSKIFKAIFTFDHFKYIETYNLCELLSFLDYMKLENLTFVGVGEGDLIEYLSGGMLNINVVPEYTSGDNIAILDVNSIYRFNDGKIEDMTHWFDQLTGCVYRSRLDDDCSMIAEVSVLPDINEINDTELDQIYRAISEYIRYVMSGYVSTNVEVVQNNYEYTRYFNEIKILRDKYPEFYVMQSRRSKWV